MRHQHADEHTHDGAVAEVALDFCYCGTELAAVERLAAGLPGVRCATADRTRAVLHLAYDPSQTSPATLRQALDHGGYGCDCVRCPASCCQPGHPAAGTPDQTAAHEEHAAHASHDAHTGQGEHAGHGADMVA